MSDIKLWLIMMGSPFIVYIIARLVFAAFFLTKAEYEKRKHHHG